MEELSKSVKASLYDRLVSPLYGSFVISWCVFNWRILYLTFIVKPELVFASDGKTVISKLQYVQDNLLNAWSNIYYPIISTIIIISVLPFVNNGAFELNERFKVWRKNRRNKIRESELITRESYLTVLNDLEREKEKFKNLLRDKEDAIRERNNALTEVSSAKDKYDAKIGLITQEAEKTKEVYLHELAESKTLLDITKAELISLEKTKNEIINNINIELGDAKTRIADLLISTNRQEAKLNQINNENISLNDRNLELETQRKKFPQLLSFYFWEGEWINNHEYPPNKHGEEIFSIVDGYKYVRNNKTLFYIDSVSFDKNTNTLRFRKISATNPDIILQNELQKINDDYYEGFEFGYSRTGQVPISYRYKINTDSQ